VVVEVVNFWERTGKGFAGMTRFRLALDAMTTRTSSLGMFTPESISTSGHEHTGF
jgi:hypothetical protein